MGALETPKQGGGKENRPLNGSFLFFDVFWVVYHGISIVVWYKPNKSYQNLWEMEIYPLVEIHWATICIPGLFLNCRMPTID